MKFLSFAMLVGCMTFSAVDGISANQRGFGAEINITNLETTLGSVQRQISFIKNIPPANFNARIITNLQQFVKESRRNLNSNVFANYRYERDCDTGSDRARDERKHIDNLIRLSYNDLRLLDECINDLSNSMSELSIAAHDSNVDIQRLVSIQEDVRTTYETLCNFLQNTSSDISEIINHIHHNNTTTRSRNDNGIVFVGDLADEINDKLTRRQEESEEDFIFNDMKEEEENDMKEEEENDMEEEEENDMEEEEEEWLEDNEQSFPHSN